jgi:predicted Fe-Mo cluster-binding NifX family protein
MSYYCFSFDDGTTFKILETQKGQWELRINNYTHFHSSSGSTILEMLINNQIDIEDYDSYVSELPENLSEWEQ